MFRHCILHASGCTAHAAEAAEFKAVDRAWGGSVRFSTQVVPETFVAAKLDALANAHAAQPKKRLPQLMLSWGTEAAPDNSAHAAVNPPSTTFWHMSVPHMWRPCVRPTPVAM